MPDATSGLQANFVAVMEEPAEKSDSDADALSCSALKMPINRCYDLASASKELTEGVSKALGASDSTLTAVDDYGVPLIKLIIEAASKFSKREGLKDLNMCMGSFTGETIMEVRTRTTLHHREFKCAATA